MSENQLLFGKFEIIETLKKDVQTAVYLANHIYLNKEIILKTLNTQQLKDQTILHRFKREAKILAKLNHPNIIRVLDFGTDNEYFYLSFEYFEGQTLREYLKTNLPDQDEYIKIISQILMGLSYAHRQKIIHRDLKPENILINQNLDIKIADFGLALSESENQVTQQESIVGTPGYMSPEQIRGESVDQRSDIFSFGIIAYELLTGINPFIGKDVAATINNILFFNQETLLKSFNDFPEKFSKIVMKCLERKKENRFQNADEILIALGMENIQFFPEEYKKLNFKKLNLKHYSSGLLILLLLILTFIYFLTNKSKTEVDQNQVQKFDNPQLTNQQIFSEVESDKPKIEQKKEKSSDENHPSSTKNTEPITSNFAQEGELYITCYPWAEIYIDDIKYEITPLTKPIRLMSGNHRLKLIHPNFPQFEKTIEIKPNDLNNLDFNFYKYFGFVQFQIIPWGEIKIDNKKIGITPLEKPLILNQGRYILTISNPNFGNFVDTINIQRGETLFYKLNLNTITNWHNN